MTYKILFLDIDGTILQPNHSIEDSTKQAVLQVQAQGIETFLATGRPVHEIKEIGDELKISSFIGYNGALALYNGKQIFAEPMKEQTVHRLLEVAKKNQHEMVLYTDNANYFTSLAHPSVTEFIKAFRLRNNKVYQQDKANQVLGMTIIMNGENDQYSYSLEDGIHFSQVNVDGMRHCFDIIRNQVNKGVGIQLLLKELNIEKEQAIAFGDGMNDKEMLQAVGEGFAMGNAHEDLFQYADHKTTSVTDSGVYNGLKFLGLIKE